MKITALVLFILTYILLLALPKWRAYIAAVVGFLFLCIGILPWQSFATAVDWNVLMILSGTMGVVSLFIDSQMPARLADNLISHSPSVKWAVILLSLMAGLISAFVDNVATVLMVAPIAIKLAQKAEISPVGPVIAIAISSNLQGAATLVGDTTSIMLGGYAGMGFSDFFVFDGMPGLFFVVQLGAIAATSVLLIVFRRLKHKVTYSEKTIVNDYFPSILLLVMIALLIATSFIEKKPSVTAGIICVSACFVGVIYNIVKHKNASGLVRTLKDIDYKTLLMLTGLFLIIDGISEVGIIDEIAVLLVKASGNNVFALYSLLVWGSVLASAFIDNIPYVAAMLPVVGGMATILGIPPYVLYFGLLCGATLGGNLTPIGASANITALGILKKQGYEVKSLQFMKISVPFTLIAVACGYGLVWAFFGV